MVSVSAFMMFMWTRVEADDVKYNDTARSNDIPLIPHRDMYIYVLPLGRQ